MLTDPLVVFAFSLVMVCFFIKKIIYIAHKKNIFDEPTETRKVHIVRTPNLGGVAVFGCFFLVSTLSPAIYSIPHLNYIILSLLLLFITGLADDLSGIDAWKKMVVQIAVAIIVSFTVGCRFTGLSGLFGVDSLPLPASIILSAGFIIFLINAFNLIDGIDCLAAGIGLLSSLIFSFYFHAAGAADLEWMCIILAGCLTGFLLFNKTPARIFLGDSGSTFIGFLMAYFSISLVNVPAPASLGLPFLSGPGSVIVLIAGILVIPVFDTVRVFYIRISRGKNPFSADRNHIHHRLLDTGLSHIQSTLVLLIVNVCIITVIFLCYGNTSEIILGMILFIITGLNWLLSFAARYHIKHTRDEQIAGKSTTKTGKVKILIESSRSILK